MTESNEAATIPMDKLARVYRKMQTKIQQLTAVYETEVEGLKAQQEVVKTALKDQMLALGVKSVNTAEGTVILSTKTRYSTQDWDAFKEFMKENDALDLLEKRIAQTNMATFLQENPTLVPPGLNSNSEYAISVRKPTK
jgi:capsule polysaccharide export protein KpsE/RkpR|tara:strand:- start:283 stop:699 length:417 start_codon:yes stop_codon:yes gene_type:complete